MNKMDNQERHRQATQMLQSGNIKSALLLLKENIKNTPTDINSIYLTGICHATAMDYAVAEQSLKRAIKLKTGETPSTYDLLVRPKHIDTYLIYLLASED